MSSKDQETGIADFINELAGFADTAEETLKKIEEDKDANKGLFSVFSKKMFTIRGTAEQLNLDQIAQIASLGEEIALKGTTADHRAQIRKCIGSLWDALTTVKYLLEHPEEEEIDETREILVNRLNRTLEAFGGARPQISSDEIDQFIASRDD